MRAMFLVCAMAAAAACGSSDKKPAPVVGSDTSAAAAVTRLTVTIEGQKMGEIVLHPDGAIEAINSEKVAKGRLDGNELSVEGEPIARRGDDGQITVRQRSRAVVDGQVVDQEESWEVVGTLAGDVLTLAKDGSQLRIEGGKVVGVPAEIAIEVELADPAQAADVLFVVIAVFTASDETSESQGPGKDQAPPASATP